MDLQRKRTSNKRMRTVEVVLILGVSLSTLGGITWYVGKKMGWFKETSDNTSEAVDRVKIEADKLRGN